MTPVASRSVNLLRALIIIVTYMCIQLYYLTSQFSRELCKLWVIGAPSLLCLHLYQRAKSMV